MKTINFTRSGLDKTKEELLDIESSKRPEAVKALQKGREMGDLSENGLYKAARFELSNIDRRIRHLKYLISYALVISPTGNSTVQIGHIVKIKNEKEEKEYKIVGDYEADPKENKISTNSPIGNALFGKKVGDNIEIKTPGGINHFKLIEIS